MAGPRLYHVAVPGFVQSRAFRCLWLLEELDVDDYEVCMLTPGQPYGAQMRAYGVPHSTKLPTFQIDGKELTDSGLISQVIAEKYASHRTLLGTTDERIDLLQWIGFAETCITFRIPLLPALMNRDKSLVELQTEAIEPVRAVFTDNVARFEAHFEAQVSDYLLPSGFSIADTMCGWSLHTFHTWGIMDLATGTSPKTLAYLERLRGRPAFASAEAYTHTSPGLYRRGCIPVDPAYSGG